MAVFTKNHEFRVSINTIEIVKSHCESTEQFSYIGAKRCKNPQKLRKWFLKGVPGKEVNFLLPEEIRDLPLVCEIGKKKGCYDGKERDEIVLRYYSDLIQAERISEGQLFISHEDEDNYKMISARWDGKKTWVEAYKCLPNDNVDPRGIIIWHWNNYYKVVISSNDLDSIVEEFKLRLPSETSLACANRIASRLLYDAARREGWRKLTLREQKLFQLEGQWHKQEFILKRVIDMGIAPTNSGVGEYTNNAANNCKMHMNEQDGYIQTTYGKVEVE